MASLAAPPSVGAESVVRGPLACSRSGQAVLRRPGDRAVHAAGRVDVHGTDRRSSLGELTHTGLYYTHDIATDCLLPAGAVSLPGSAHFVPHTGTANVLPAARVWHDGGLLRVVLPAHVVNGSGYTPPSVEFQLSVTAAVGAQLPLRIARVQVAANVFLLGDLHTECKTEPRSSVLATTLVTPAPSHNGSP